MASRQVTVSDAGTIAADPDALSVSLAVTGSGSDPAAALQSCGAAQDAVVEVLRAAGATRLRLGGVSVQQEWDHERGRQGQPRGTARLSALLPGRSAAGPAVARALEAGGKGVALESLSPVVSYPAALLPQARERAYADARGKAEHYAGLSGSLLGEVLSLGEGGVPDERPGGWFAQSARAAAAYAVPETDVDVSVTLVVTWELLAAP